MEKHRILTEEEIDQVLEERHTSLVHKKIKAAKVAIAGLGGLGSNIALLLARAGVGNLLLVDFDLVDESNLNRQAYKMKDLGRYKTEALAEEIKEINPYTHLEIQTVRITEENAGEVFDGHRLICEAFDKAENKAMLINVLMEKLPSAVFVSGSGMAGYGSSNEIVTKRKLSRLYLCGDEKSDIAKGQCLMAPRVAICAAHQANMVLRLILEETEV